MKYIDLHCDALTKEGVACVTADSLRAGDCALQCFAAFLDGGKGEGFARAMSLCDAFDAMCEEKGLRPVKGGCELAGEPCAMLTVEGGEAVGAELENLGTFYSRGVRMLGLTWNYPNALGGCAAAPAVGLTPFGRACVERMCELGMLPDVSHGSDALVADVAEICKERGMPFVASHSNARAVFACPRNLTDEGIRLIAESGGVIGLNFFADFLSDDRTCEGQRAALLSHAKHILNAGGEDVLALGSDFDGAPANPYVASPASVPKLLADFARAFTPRLAEKIAFSNALRVLSFAL